METIKNILEKLKDWSINYESDVEFILRMESEYDLSKMKRKTESEETCN